MFKKATVCLGRLLSFSVMMSIKYEFVEVSLDIFIPQVRDSQLHTQVYAFPANVQTCWSSSLPPFSGLFRSFLV